MKHKIRFKIASTETDPKVGGSESVRCRDVGCGCGGVGKVGVDVGQQVTHDCWHSWTHVLCRQAGKVTTPRQSRKGQRQREEEKNRWYEIRTSSHIC